MKLLLLVLWSSFAFASTYTPTVANVEYIFPESIVSHKAQYFVVDGIVHVAGSVEVQADSQAMFNVPAGARLSISLPVSTTLTSEYDCNGTVGEGPHYNTGEVYADPSSGKAIILFDPSTASDVYDSSASDNPRLHYEFDCEVK